jgi:2-dehydropantoate 2-reductase
MRFLILGAGAIGTWIGANLVMARQSVTFVGRAPFVQAACAQGIHVTLPGGETWRLRDLDVATSLAEALQRPSSGCDAILLCMKSFALDGAIAELRECAEASSNASLLAFQNGVGSEEKLAAVFGEQRVVAATLTSPISMEGPAAVRLERLGGGVGLAALTLRAGERWQMTQAMACAPLLAVRTYADWRAMKWSKLLLNLIGNATSALLGASPAEIYANRRLFAVEMRMLREAVAVMDAHAPAIEAVNLPGYPARVLAFALRVLPYGLLQPILARRVARGRGNKMPSLYDDVAHRTGRSEVTALNGAVVAAGRRLGVPTPVNAALTEMVLRAVQPDANHSCQAARRALEQLASG